MKANNLVKVMEFASALAELVKPDSGIPEATRIPVCYIASLLNKYTALSSVWHVMFIVS